jgi:hypothetical protein
LSLWAVCYKINKYAARIALINAKTGAGVHA